MLSQYWINLDNETKTILHFGAPIIFLPAVQCLSYSLENTFHVVLDSLSTYSFTENIYFIIEKQKVPNFVQYSESLLYSPSLLCNCNDYLFLNSRISDNHDKGEPIGKFLYPSLLIIALM